MTRDEAIKVLRGQADALTKRKYDDAPAVDAAIDVLERLSSEPLGAKDIAVRFGIKVPNLKHLKLEPRSRISGGAIPVYLTWDADRLEEDRRAKRAAASE